MLIFFSLFAVSCFLSVKSVNFLSPDDCRQSECEADDYTFSVDDPQGVRRWLIKTIIVSIIALLV